MAVGTQVIVLMEEVVDPTIEFLEAEGKCLIHCLPIERVLSMVRLFHAALLKFIELYDADTEHILIAYT